MKHIRTCLCLLCVSVFLLVSCGNSANDGVVIIPSSRGEAVSAETTAETEADSAVQVGTAEPESAETAAETVSVPEGTDMLEKAEALLEDAAFLAYLDRYGVDVTDSDVRGIIAAVLAYRTEEAAESVVSGAASESDVYWTVGGSVWHVTRGCSALAKSKNISVGSVGQALANGKTRACKRCAE